MRIGSVIFALGIVIVLAVWFSGDAPEGEVSAPGAGAISAGAAVIGDPGGLRPVSVMVLPVEETEITHNLILRGRTEANRTVNVAAETTGTVVSEPLRRGTEVATGQILCELSAGTREAERRQAQANLARASADFDAAERLSKRGFTAETTRMTREAEMEAAQAALDQIELDIRKLRIVAPFAGTLETDTAELGARLAPGDVCATVIDLSKVKVSGFVGETEIDRIALGRAVDIRLLGGSTATGEISFVSRMADEETRTFQVAATLENPEHRIRDGMTAELVIPLPARRGHLVPQSALTLDDEGRLGLRIAAEGRARFVPVTMIRDGREGVWVQGLPESASVIVVGQEFVRDGREIEAVTVTREELG